MNNNDSDNSLVVMPPETESILKQYLDKTGSDTEGEVLMKALSIMEWYFTFEDNHYIFNEETKQFNSVKLEFKPSE